MWGGRGSDHGRLEASGWTLVVQPASAEKLDARAGVNFRLLRESLMVSAPSLCDGSTTHERAEVAAEAGIFDGLSAVFGALARDAGE